VQECEREKTVTVEADRRYGKRAASNKTLNDNLEAGGMGGIRATALWVKGFHEIL